MSANVGVITGKSARKSAKAFYYGNIAAGLFPLPLFILWFAASIVVYAMFRHHPHPRVGYYTQMAAYSYYGLAGTLVVLLTFASLNFFLEYWLATWIVIALVLLPFSILQILRINKENWQDVDQDVDI